MLDKSEGVCVHVCVCERECVFAAVISPPEGQRFQSLDTTYRAKLNNLEAFAVEKLNKHVLFCGTPLVLCLRSIHVKSSTFICIMSPISQLRNLTILSEEEHTTILNSWHISFVLATIFLFLSLSKMDLLKTKLMSLHLLNSICHLHFNLAMTPPPPQKINK